MTPMAGKFLCYASIANVLAVVMAAVAGSVTAKMKGLNGNGEILAAKSAQVQKEEEQEQKRPGTSADYVALGSGIFMSFCLYLLGNILGHIPGFSVIPGLAWTIILGIIIKFTGLLPDQFADNCVYSMNFALKALLPMLIAGIGINSLKFSTLAEYFSPGAFVVIFLAVFGAMLGAMIFGKLSGLWAYEAGVTAGLCCCNIGGSGDLAVLSAANRMNLLAFAYGALGDSKNEQINYNRMNSILATIEDSGNGLKEGSAWHILMFGHALDLLAAHDRHYGKARVVSRSVEYVPLLEPVRTEEGRIKGYYFDYSRIYRNKPDGYVFKRPRTWQFNNLRPREYK